VPANLKVRAEQSVVKMHHRLRLAAPPRAFFQISRFHLELLHLTAQPGQLGSFGRGQRQQTSRVRNTCSAPSALTQLPSVVSLNPRSRAISATVFVAGLDQLHGLLTVWRALFSRRSSPYNRCLGNPGSAFTSSVVGGGGTPQQQRPPELRGTERDGGQQPEDGYERAREGKEQGRAECEQYPGRSGEQV
jgi:hypothetical protein